MSSDHGPGAPSFGDLFEDPDSPLTPSSDDQAARGEHDLDHESAEASHLVAGFEAQDDPIVVQPREQAGAGVDVLPVADEPGVVVPAAPAASTLTEPPGADEDDVQVAPVAAAAVAAGSSTGTRSAWDGTVDPAVSSAPAARVDTGRLYRSAGAEGPATLDAIPAIDPAHSPSRRAEPPEERPAELRSGDRGLTYSGVVVIVVGATVLVALAEALLRKEIGAITGVALLVSSVYSAVVVRRADIWAAVVIPPLAFLVAVLTAGQLTILGKSGGLLVREGALLFVSLATNAPWILGTTLVCLVIVLVRRRRAQAPA